MILDRDACIRIPKRLINENWVQQVLKDLTRKSKSFSDSEVIETKLYYDTTNDDILIPRFYPIESFGHTTISSFKEPEKISINDKIDPRNSKQKDAIKWMTSTDRGVLCMKPGDGKTVVTIKSICTIGEKSIIFVHTTPLLEQWADRISEHTCLPRDQVGIFSGSSYEKQLRKPIVVSTVQSYISFLKGNFNSTEILKNAGFGVAVWDECHTSVSAEQFSKSSLNAYARRCYGLSATPERLDGNTDIIKYHLTDVYHPTGESQYLDCRVVMIYLDFGLLPKYKYRIYQLYLEEKNSNRGVLNKGVYLSLLGKSDKLFKTIKQIVKQCSDKGRNTLILSERINLIAECSKSVPPEHFGEFTGQGTEDRDKVLRKQIIGATYQKGRDGLDVPRLDTIIFLTPPSNIEQAVGRIQRTHANKEEPVVIDIVDKGCEDMINRSKYRQKFYTSKGWLVEEKHL